MTAGDGKPGLPPFQLEVARMFFALPASRGFLLGEQATVSSPVSPVVPPAEPGRDPLHRAGPSSGCAGRAIWALGV